MLSFIITQYFPLRRRDNEIYGIIMYKPNSDSEPLFWGFNESYEVRAIHVYEGKDHG